MDRHYSVILLLFLFAALTAFPAQSSSPPSSAPSGRVEVAEAIRVPLSNTLLTPLTFNLVKSPHVSAFDGIREGYHRPGWLDIYPFLNETNAIELWQNIRSAVPEKAAGLGIRIAKSTNVSKGSPWTTLNVGPFADRADAFAFCRDFIQSADDKLRCHFDNAEPSASFAVTTVGSQPADNAHSNKLTAQQAAQLAPTASRRLYWAQVISAGSQIEALQAWDGMRSANQDILGGWRSSVSASPADKTQYVVRLGPITSDIDAVDLCDTLRDRGIDCHVLSSGVI